MQKELTELTAVAYTISGVVPLSGALCKASTPLTRPKMA